MNKPKNERVITMCFSCSRLRSFQYQLVKVSTERGNGDCPCFFSTYKLDFHQYSYSSAGCVHEPSK